MLLNRSFGEHVKGGEGDTGGSLDKVHTVSLGIG